MLLPRKHCALLGCGWCDIDCRKYGSVSDDLTFTEENEEFKDWHVTMHYEDEHVKMLCCLEDIVCCTILKGIHFDKECRE